MPVCWLGSSRVSTVAWFEQCRHKYSKYNMLTLQFYVSLSTSLVALQVHAGIILNYFFLNCMKRKGFCSGVLIKPAHVLNPTTPPVCDSIIIWRNYIGNNTVRIPIYQKQSIIMKSNISHTNYQHILIEFSYTNGISRNSVQLQGMTYNCE